MTKLTGRIVVPGDKEYTEARMDFNRRFNKFPKVIVFCQNVQDVINAVKWARERNVPLRPRGGRHSYEAFSVLDGGIVIDVSEMNHISVDTKKGIAVIETGARLGKVYTDLSSKGVIIPAGTDPDVGIAGLTLGGGIGFLSRRLGLTCDNLLAVQMVQAVGKTGAKLITATKKENSDLFWASQGGGGGNFGVATKYVFRVHPISNVVIYKITWDWEHIEKVVNVWQHWAPFVNRNLTASIFLHARQTGIITSSGQYVGTEAKLKELIKPLLQAAIPVKVEIKTVPFIEAVDFFAGNDQYDRPIFKNTGSYVYKLLPNKAIKVIRSFLENTPNQDAFVWGQSFGGAVSQVPSNGTAYVHRRAKYILEYGTKWEKKSEEGENIRWAEGIRNSLLPFTVGDYVNWVDLGIKNYPAAYYKSNYRRLQEIKRKYDPHNVFHFPQSIKLT